MNHTKSHAHTLTATAILLLSSIVLTPVYANKVTKLTLSTQEGFVDAPVIKVYSSDGERWDKIDMTHVTSITAQLRAECKYEGKGNKAYNGKFFVSGFEVVGDVEPANFLIPHSKTVSGNFKFTDGSMFDPVKACNDELSKKIATQPDLKLDKKYRKYPFLSQGLKLNYPAVIDASYNLLCRPTGIGRSQLKTARAKLNTKLECQGSLLAGEKIPKKPIEVKVATLVPLVSNVSFKPEPAKHVGTCPTGVKFKGNITATRAGQVKYQYVANDGGESPVFTMDFAKAGTQATGNWNETVSKRDKSKSFLSTNGKAGPDVSGWWKLKIISPQSPHNATAKYSVFCQDKPVPLRKRTTR